LIEKQKWLTLEQKRLSNAIPVIVRKEQDQDYLRDGVGIILDNMARADM